MGEAESVDLSWNLHVAQRDRTKLLELFSKACLQAESLNFIEIKASIKGAQGNGPGLLM